MEMSVLQKDRDRLMDQATGTLSPDEVLQTTRTERDAIHDRWQHRHTVSPTYTHTLRHTVKPTHTLTYSGLLAT